MASDRGAARAATTRKAVRNPRTHWRTTCPAPRRSPVARYRADRLEQAAVKPTAVRESSTEKAGITSW